MFRVLPVFFQQNNCKKLKIVSWVSVLVSLRFLEHNHELYNIILIDVRI